MAVKPASGGAPPALIYPEVARGAESYGGVHPTGNLSGYPAIDFFAPAGTYVVAPEAGRIVKESGSPTSQPPQGTGKAFGLSEYLQGISGTTYFITHLGSENVKVGQAVKQGEVLGTVADFTPYGVPSHAHIGASGPVDVSTLASASKISQLDAALVTGSSHAGFSDGLKQIFTTLGTPVTDILSGKGGSAGSDTAKAAAGIPGKLLGIDLQRFAEMISGAVLVLLALIITGKAATMASPVAQTRGAIRTARAAA